MTRTRLPIVDVADPCDAPTTAMLEIDGQRILHCYDCEKNVYNLSLMTEAEALALLRDKGSGEICVQFYRRADGTVQTIDCTPKRLALIKERTRRVTRRAIGLGAVVFASLFGMMTVHRDVAGSAKRLQKPVAVAPTPSPARPPAPVIAPAPPDIDSRLERAARAPRMNERPRNIIVGLVEY